MISRETRGNRIGSCVKMSALGQKPTYAVQNGMSALPPIATAKADIRIPVPSPRRRRQEERG